MGITNALVDFAFDPDTGEGSDAALSKAEKWRSALEEMIEVGKPIERNALLELNERVGDAICEILRCKLRDGEKG